MAKILDRLNGMLRGDERTDERRQTAEENRLSPIPDKRVTDEDVRRGEKILQEYQEGKKALEHRIIEEEEWYELRYQDYLRNLRNDKHKEDKIPDPTSAYLFNTIINKHADCMDNFPTPNVLPREEGDRDNARLLSSVLPVVLEYNDFEQVYSDAAWEKYKHGTSVTAVLWNPNKDHGLGDVDIKMVDILDIYWEPGIRDIQDSRNVFVVNLVDNDLLEAEYPELKLNAGAAGSQFIARYRSEDNVELSELHKSLVIDWYYKEKINGQVRLQYVKMCEGQLLFASANDPAMAEKGWYEDGMYPFVMDTLFPEKRTPAGFGMIAISKDPQLYIDRLDRNILTKSLQMTKPRWFVSKNTDINKEQFMDWNQTLVEVNGNLDDTRLREIVPHDMGGIYVNVREMKVAEMKETAANRDVSSGGGGAGITAASAIAALQEAGNKVSRDAISTSYRAHKRICHMVIERMRQFYDSERTFRIAGDDNNPGQYSFATINRGMLAGEMLPGMDGGEPVFRRPIFDIDIRPAKKSPFNRASQNELATSLYGAGVFDPARAQEAQGLLMMMDFDGKDQVVQYVSQGQTLARTCQELNQRLDQMAALLQLTTGQDMGLGQQAPQQPTAQPVPSTGINAAMAEAQKPMTYQEKILRQGSMDMDKQ